MYGIILENIAGYIREYYGLDCWQEIQYVAALEDTQYEPHEQYSEGVAQRIIWAAQDVTGDSMDVIMEAVGTTFYEFLKVYEYDKILRVLGRTFTDFLNGLDNLHEYIRFSYPVLKPPSFYCEHESKSGLTLHYRSKRHGFIRYVVGQIVNIGKTLYDVDVKIEIVDKEIDENMNHHVIMRLHFNNLEFDPEQVHQQVASKDRIQNIVQVTSQTLFDIFPFIVVFNRGMRIRNVGMGLMRVMPKMIGKRISSEFVLVRPSVSFKWEEIMQYSNNQFELMSVDPVFTDDNKIYYISGDMKEVEQERRRMQPEEKVNFLTLKGQMLYMHEWEAICFLGIPLMENLDQMYRTGLYLNDFALHDSSRDLVLAGTQQQAEIRLLLDQEEKKKDKMEESMQKLEAERSRTDKILYQLLPRSVAEKLRSGADAKSTCESFNDVTVLQTDIVGFTTICSGITPMAVVQLLNNMYSQFDEFTEQHGVFKVETIGDAYVIVGGAPSRTQHHAELVLDCAMAMVQATGKMTEKSTKKAIRIRAGIHSGPVMAGVVGLKMPRYCLFGDTVLLAQKMESTSQPMRIQASEDTKKALTKVASNLFQFTDAAEIDTKHGKKLKSYFVDGKSGPPRIPDQKH